MVANVKFRYQVKSKNTSSFIDCGGHLENEEVWLGEKVINILSDGTKRMSVWELRIVWERLGWEH